MGSKLDNNTSSSDSNQINLQESRKLSIERCISCLAHACYCSDVSCPISSCLKLKQIIIHYKQCKRKHSKTCSLCKQFISFCYHHAKACQDTNCAVLLCLIMRHKIQQQTLIQGQEQALKRRIATKQNRGMPYTTPSQSFKNSSYASSLLSSAPCFPTFEYPTQPGFDMKPPAMSQDKTPIETNQGQIVGLGMPQKSLVKASNLSTSNRNSITKNDCPVEIATRLSRLNISSESSDFGIQSIIDMKPPTMSQNKSPMETNQGQIVGLGMPQKSLVEASNLSTSNRNSITKNECPVEIATRLSRLNISSESSDFGSQSIIAPQPSAPQDPTQPGIDINPTTMTQGLNPIQTVQEENSLSAHFSYFFQTLLPRLASFPD